jgi:Ca-activated chloride channel family protein
MGVKDYYALLGVPRDATSDQIRRAYREAALRYHPDRNVKPGETELFLEIGEAYEMLIDPEKRASYDHDLTNLEEEQSSSASFQCSTLHSRNNLLQIGEPQVHYTLIEISPAAFKPDSRAPINLCIVIDRSTSMQGQRLDQVRGAALSILKQLKEQDSASIIAFSDHAESIVSPDQARDVSVARARLSLLQAGGGTEIGQGLKTGMEQLAQSFLRNGVNHLILLTDGRTYGDEDLCQQIAAQAAESGITISGIGIGSDWNDRLLDEISAQTGGSVSFLDTPRSVHQFLQEIFSKLSQVFASRMRLNGSLSQLVDLRSAFRLLPEPMPLGDSLPIMLGNLTREENIRILLEFVIHPVGKIEDLTLGHLSVIGDILGLGAETQTYPLKVVRPVSDQPDASPPPEEIYEALSRIALYRLQEKARHEAELGQAIHAARRLENLATQLLATGQRDLAKAALNEAARVSHTRRFSTLGEKMLKYGTRSLLLPAKLENE